MKVHIVVSDQHENTSAIPGWPEGRLVEPIGLAAVQDLIARGHEARYYDPHKTYDVQIPVRAWNPEAVVFVHVNGGSYTGPMKLMAVDCSHWPNTSWSDKIVASMSQTMVGFPYGGVYTDWYLRGFCFWFYKDLRSINYAGKRTVIEMGNMKNLAQATYLKDHPQLVGAAISHAVAPITLTAGRPYLRFPATTEQPLVTVKTIANGDRYYVDTVKGSPRPEISPTAWVQRALNAHYPTLPALVADGWYGPRTAERVEKFQREHWLYGIRLTVNGDMDDRTWKKLLSVTK